MHSLRRKLVTWLRGGATQRQLDGVLGSVVRVSEGAGCCCRRRARCHSGGHT